MTHISQTTPKTLEARFEIIESHEEVYDDPREGPKLTRVTVTKRYRSVINGSGVAHVLTVQGENGSGYVASERVVGTLDGREGTFVIQHGGLAHDGEQTTYGTVIAGSGTGQLVNLAGKACEMEQGVLTLEYILPG